MHFVLRKVSVDAGNFARFEKASHVGGQRARGIPALRSERFCIAGDSHRPPRFTQFAGQFEAQGGAFRDGLVDAAGSLGRACRLLPRKPKRSREFDFPLLPTEITVEAVVETADTDRARLRCESGGDLARRARLSVARISDASIDVAFDQRIVGAS